METCTLPRVAAQPRQIPNSRFVKLTVDAGHLLFQQFSNSHQTFKKRKTELNT
jgi:tellurite resistance-related uncharacterized protein